jgi:hypothetical protein
LAALKLYIKLGTIKKNNIEFVEKSISLNSPYLESVVATPKLAIIARTAIIYKNPLTYKEKGLP